MKKILVLLFLCIAASPLFAQSRSIGNDLLLLGEFDRARAYFEAQLETNPVEANFFLGEIAFAQGDIDTAAKFYGRSAIADPGGVLPMIGQAKLALNMDNVKAAETIFNNLMTQRPTDLNMILLIGRAFLDNGMADKAMAKVEAARKLNDRAPEVYILEGDIIASGKTSIPRGEASVKYETATYFDPNFALGYMKTAQMYESHNPTHAAGILRELMERRPDYSLAREALINLYLNSRNYAGAVEIFRAVPPTTLEDIEKYARALYMTGEFDAARTVIAQGLEIAPDDFRLNRYLMYIHAKQENTVEGLPLAERVIAMGEEAGYLIVLDFTSYATLLRSAGRHEDALAQLERAINLNQGSVDLYREAAEAAARLGRYAMAAEFYEIYIGKRLEASDGSYTNEFVDLNQLGRYYYNAASVEFRNPESAARMMANSAIVERMAASDHGFDAARLATDSEYFVTSYTKFGLTRASSIFARVLEQFPDNHSVHRYKALVEHALRPAGTQVSAAAKEHYERVVELITARDDWRNDQSLVDLAAEGYDYLAIYYFLADDHARALEFSRKALELNPESPAAKQILPVLTR